MPVVVLSPATEFRLTTLANVRMDTGSAIGAVDDRQVERFIDQASRRAASFCRRTFGRETVRERIDLACGFTEGGGILLDRGPAFRVASAAIDDVAVVPESFLIADGRELYLLQDGEPVRWRGRSLSVVYEAGWLLPGEGRGDPPTTTAPDLPADVEQAVIQLVGVAVSASGRDAMVKGETVDGIGSTSFYVQGSTASLPHPEAEAALADYRRLVSA